jgi:hypothetical protein
MSLFERLGGQHQQQNQQQAMEAMRKDVDEIKAGPSAYLSAHGYKIPDGMTDAKEITQYLLRTGQIGTPRLNQVVNMLGLRR